MHLYLAVPAQWQKMEGHDGYNDQQADLTGGFYAEVGPDSGGRWSWTIISPEGDEVDDGVEDDEGSAKSMAEGWRAMPTTIGRYHAPPFHVVESATGRIVHEAWTAYRAFRLQDEAQHSTLRPHHVRNASTGRTVR